LEADLAEETLDEYIRWLLDAQQEQLAEHREFGLPDFAATAETFQQAGWLTHTFKLANVYNWLLMMVAKHYLISMRDSRASAFERALDRYYNLSFFETDRSEPAYRGAVVAVRPGLEQALARIGEAYPPVVESDTANTTRLGLTQVLMNLLNLKSANHEDRLLREQMERRDRHIAAMETRSALQDVQNQTLRDQAARLEDHARALEEHVRAVELSYKDEFAGQAAYIGRLESDLKSKDEHILYLERLLQGIEAGRVFRLTRSVSRLLKR
jgi:hypothetical protein